ncbi:MAG: PAS domain-containing protein [Calditerrivibrio sp.]|nr:PAS domain-containing protein [Calditerrivibrio sp.]
MNKDIKMPDYYIAIGASAGGLEAIEQFVTNMPEKNNFGIIIIQHLSPDYKSMMAEILSKKTNIPVHKSEDGMLVEAGNIYLIPPKKNLTISQGRLVLNEPNYSGGLNFPIDLFLRSLAEDQGEKAIAIILSGTGSDGVRGIRAIKQHGGIIFVQDETTAKFDGMPKAAISTGLVDFIMKPSDMPKQIISMLEYPTNFIKVDQDRVVTDEEILNKIFSLIKTSHGVDFSYYKPSTITRRLERRMSINKLEDISDYLNYMYKNPSEVAILFKEFLIGVTSFFRDTEVFLKLEQDVIPDLLNRIPDAEIRVWVAGCSTGEEAYSIAIIFKEVMEKLNIIKQLKIFATDIDKRALQFAAVGAYPESITADVPVNYLSKYFIKQGNQFVITRSVRESIVFAEHNLIKDPPFTNISFISCRNLLIYLKPETQLKVLRNFHFSLKTHGVLLLGNSETIGDLPELFDIMDPKLKIYESLGAPKVTIDYNIEKSPLNGTRRIGTNLDRLKYYTAEENEKLLEMTLSQLSNGYFDALVIVNSAMDVMYMEGNLSNYFTMPKGKPVIELEKITTRDLSIPIVNGVKKCFKSNKRLKYRKILHKKNKKKTVLIDMFPFTGYKKEQYCLIVLSNLDMVHKDVHFDDQVSLEIPSHVEERIKDLENELQITKENLQATIEELETSNEELQATNEELLASNEELQSTNEELQSTNEELYTVNNELQSKILELTELQNDLDNLLTSSAIGILMLDLELKIRKFSPKIREIFKVIELDVGRSITHISHFIEDVDPYQLFKTALSDFGQKEYEVKTSSNNYFLMRIMPFLADIPRNHGLVVTFIDITQYKKLYESISIRDQIIKATQKISKVGGWYYDIVHNTMFWTDEVYAIHGLEKRYFGSDPMTYIERSLICYGDRADDIMEAFKRCVREGVAYDLVVPFKKYTGEEIVVKTTGNAVYDGNKIIGVVGTITDMSNK